MKRKAEKKETEERLEKQRAEKQEQEERQYNLKIDGKDVTDLTGKMVELLGTSTSIGVMEMEFRHLMCWHRNFDMKP